MTLDGKNMDNSYRLCLMGVDEGNVICVQAEGKDNGEVDDQRVTAYPRKNFLKQNYQGDENLIKWRLNASQHGLYTTGNQWRAGEKLSWSWYQPKAQDDFGEYTIPRFEKGQMINSYDGKRICIADATVGAGATMLVAAASMSVMALLI